MAKKVLPHRVRIAAKSLEHSLNVLKIGKFNPSGNGSKAYHERNVANKTAFMEKFGHLKDVWLK